MVYTKKKPNKKQNSGTAKKKQKETALQLAQLAISLGLELAVLEWKLFRSRLHLVLYVFNVPYFHLCVISNSKTELSLQLHTL